MTEAFDTEEANTAVRKQLAELGQEPVTIPSADEVYWRAQAQMVLDRSDQRRRDTLKPLTRFQTFVGAGSVAAGVIACLLPLLTAITPATMSAVAPLIVLLTALGGTLVADARS